MGPERGRVANGDCWDSRGCPDPDECTELERCAAEPLEVTGRRRELEHDEPERCPMGCGRPTDDAAGGPCRSCWDAVPRPGP